MRRTSCTLALALALSGCSDITGGENGVVALEVVRPEPATLEVGETLQMTARALDASGEEVAATIEWRTVDTTLAVDAAGLVTGLFAGAGRVQALEGSLVSQPITLTVLAGVDSLHVAPDTLLVPATTAVSGPLVATALQRSDTATSGYIPVPGRDIIATIEDPLFPDPDARTVEFGNGALADTATTDVSGQPTPALTLARVTGQTAPDTVRVALRVERASGIPVPGSGGVIVVVFE